MKNSPSHPSWTDYLAAKKATSIVEDNPWLAIVLLWLSCTVPYVTRCQIVDFLKDILFKDDLDWQKPSKVSQRVRFCFNKLSKCGVLSDPIKTYFRPIVSFDHVLFDTAEHGDKISPILAPVGFRNQPGEWTLKSKPSDRSDPQTAYRLRLDSPASSVIKHASAKSEIHALLSKHAVFAYEGRATEISREVQQVQKDGGHLQLMNLPHWLGNSEILLQSIVRSSDSSLCSPGLVAVPSSLTGSPPRLMAFRHDCLRSLGCIESVAELDHQYQELHQEMTDLNRGQAIAFTYLPKDWYSPEIFPNSKAVAGQIENTNWLQAKVL